MNRQAGMTFLIALLLVLNVGAASQPSTQPARTYRNWKPQLLTLGDAFAAVHATPDQQAQVQALITHTGDRWCDWIRRNHHHLDQTRKALHAAALAGDSELADQLRREYIALVSTLPTATQTWDKAKTLFSPDQQSKLDTLKPQAALAPELLGGPLHDAVQAESAKAEADPKSQCALCHLPLEKVAAK